MIRLFCILFLGSAFCLTSGNLNTSSLTCYTCVNITIPDLKNSRIIKKTRYEIFSDACWLPPWVKPHQQKCQHPDEVCAEVLLFGGDQRIIIRTCLNLTLPEISNSCGFLRGAHHSESAHKFFNGFFHKRDQIITRVCTCTKNNCSANTVYEKNAKQYGNATFQTLKTQDLMHRKFLEIISTSTVYGFLLDRFAETMSITTAFTTAISTTDGMILPKLSGFNQTEKDVFTENSTTLHTNEQSSELPPGQMETHISTEYATKTTEKAIINDSNVSDDSTKDLFNSDLLITTAHSSESITDETKQVISNDTKFDEFSDQRESSKNLDNNGVNTSSLILWILVSTTVISVVFGIILAIVLLKRHLNSSCKQTTQAQVPAPFMDNDFLNTVVAELETEFTVSNPYTCNIDALEIKEDEFTLEETKLLGSGAFGLVCKGKVVDNGNLVECAVKMAKHQADRNALKALLSEMKVLIYIGSHDNIVRLIGCSTENVKLGRLLVFLDFCSLGSLDKYLRANQPKLSVTTLDQQQLIDLIKWATEISRGMEFVASKKLIHADLATRNVLLNSNKTARIADFGLSRRLYNYSSYVKTHQEPLPWRWMAPESLRKLEFTEKTDVWAYAVLLWELFTFADVPYPGLSWVSDFVEQLEEGLRLAKPKYSPIDMYELMQSCWNMDPMERPRFSEIREILEKKHSSLLTSV